MMKLRLLHAIALPLMLAGCVTPPDSSVEKPRDTKLFLIDDSRWVLKEMRNRDVSRPPRISFKIEHGKAGGYSGCNWYGGDLETGNRGFHLGEISQTARACIDEGLNEREKMFHRTLREVTSWGRDGDRLVLSNPSGERILVFDPVPTYPMDPADLAETDWLLEPDDEEPDDARLSFNAKGGISGFAGCREFDGTYVASGDELAVQSLSMRTMECADQALSLAEGRFLDGLSEAERWKLDEDRLELYTSSGRTLVFVRR